MSTEHIPSKPELDIEGHSVVATMRIMSETPQGDPVVLEHDSEVTFSRAEFDSLNEARARAGADPVTEQQYVDSVLDRLGELNDSVMGETSKPAPGPSLFRSLIDLLPEKAKPVRVVRLSPDDLDNTPSQIAANLD